MPSFDAAEILNRDFLEIRARLLQVAAAFDRIDRAAGTVAGDPRVEQLQRALAVLQSSAANRAEQIQLIFSRLYDENWQREFGLPRGGETAAKTNGHGPANGAAPKRGPSPK